MFRSLSRTAAAASRAGVLRVPARSTTILAVRKGDKVVVIGDGQVSMGNTVVKANALKIRRIGADKNIVAGFAGSTADAFSLLEKLEAKIAEYPGSQLMRACVETAKLWRTDKYLRHLEAMLIVCDGQHSLCLSGNGDVIAPADGILAIGSGGNYALAAARALIDVEGQDAMAIARKAMTVAADICVFTNHSFVVESIDVTPEAAQAAAAGDSVLSSKATETVIATPAPSAA